MTVIPYALASLSLCHSAIWSEVCGTFACHCLVPADGTVCVAHINDHWMRCQVLSSINAMSIVLLLDIGGTVTVPSSSLRQIRYDYMTLPFQASQCFLHGVQPVTGVWPLFSLY